MSNIFLRIISPFVLKFPSQKVKAVLVFFVLPGFIFSASALDTIVTGKDYKGKTLELEGQLEHFSWSRSMGTYGGTAALHLKLPSSEGAEIDVYANFSSNDKVIFAPLKIDSMLRLKGSCISSTEEEIKSAKPPQKRICIQLNKVTVLSVDNVALGSGTEQNAGKASKGESESVAATSKAEKTSDVSYDEKLAMKSIITVKGSKGSGSGFIANYKGKKYLVTNIHVIFDNDVQFFTPDNQKLEVGKAVLANDRDMAFFELKGDSPPPLEVHEDNQTLGDKHPIIVYGNSLGDGVNTRLKGVVKGLTPLDIEISAEIVPGNSGSPIISSKSGKVVGIATYGVFCKPTFSEKGVTYESVRRFGMRLDTAIPENFQELDTKKYESDVKIHNTLAAMNELALMILTDIHEGQPTLDAGRYDPQKYPSMQGVIRDWNDLMATKTGKKSSITVETVLKRMKTQISSPVASMKTASVNYKWIKAEIDRKIELNDYYCGVFDKIRKEYENRTRQ